MPLAMENDVSSGPLHIALLRPDTVVLESDAVRNWSSNFGAGATWVFSVLSDMVDVLGDIAHQENQ
jgi:hypothetical protein